MNIAFSPSVASETGTASAPLRDADAWLFDLDNTLYPASCRLFDQIDARMKEFVGQLLGIGPEEAYRVQKDYFKKYGTTLRGLMACHDVDADAFLAHVHDIDLSPVAPAPELDGALGALPGRKLIFTNATTTHAERVLDRIGIRHHIEAIFDIRAADFIPKPDPAPYQTLLQAYGIAPHRAVMVEDIARNLAPAAELGLTTVWLQAPTDCPVCAEPPTEDAAHIHHTISDLGAWLAAL